jgi:flagellar motor switch protein FliG
MAEIDYPNLSRRQKLALFMISIGPDAAAELMKNFDEDQAEMIGRDMSTFSVVPDRVLKQVEEEFTGIISESRRVAFGGLGYVKRVFVQAKGEAKANMMLERFGVAPQESTVVIKDIGAMDPMQIYNLVKNERSQTIAFVLSYLEPTKCAAVFSMLNPELHEDVVEKIGTIDATSVELVAKLVKNVNKSLVTNSKTRVHLSGGVPSVAALMKVIGRDMTKNILNKLEERNKTFTDAVRKKMFGFEDLAKLEAKHVQRLMRDVDVTMLPSALKGASQGLIDKIMAAMSKRAASDLKDEIALLGPVKLKDVEAAQDAIILVLRALEEAGEVSLDTDAPTDVA